MNRLILSLMVVFAMLLGSEVRGDVLSPMSAERLGLVEAWHRQLGVVNGAASLVDAQLWVQQGQQTQYVEVVRAGEDVKPVADAEVLRRISIDSKNAMGQSIGAKEADRLARLDVLKLKRRNIKATTRTSTVKQVRLYTLSEDGNVSALDAETGELLWSVRVGKPHLGYAKMGISEKHVSVVNGTTLFRILTSEETVDGITKPGGRPLPAVRLDRVPLIGVTNTDNYALVPTTNSGMEAYNFDDVPGQPGFEMYPGQLLVKPQRFSTSSLVGWTTSAGYLFVMQTAGTPTTWFRLKTDGASHGGPAASTGDRFFLGSSGGRVYGVHASRAGDVLWNVSVAEPVYQTPFVAGEQVLVPSSYGNLFCLSAGNGQPIWAAPVPNIDSVFARIDDQLFARTTSGLLTVINSQSGQTIPIAETIAVDHTIVNSDSNRLYLLDPSGAVQCLRQSKAQLPSFYHELPTTPKESQSAPLAQTDPGASDPLGTPPAADTAMEGDPFAGGAGGNDPFAAGTDPFSAGGDPFSAGGGEMDKDDAKEDDPFAE